MSCRKSAKDRCPEDQTVHQIPKIENQTHKKDRKIKETKTKAKLRPKNDYNSSKTPRLIYYKVNIIKITHFSINTC